MTKHTPATPLHPSLTDHTHPLYAGKGAPLVFHPNGIMHGKVWYPSITQLPAEVQRRCNAYPRLVEALRECAGFLEPIPEDEDSQCAIVYERAIALLAELGE